MDDEEYPWPQEGDQVFGSGEHTHGRACVRFGASYSHLYTRGYKVAADILVDRIAHVKPVTTWREAGEELDPDSLVYPIVFMYRHYLELQLKDMISWGNVLLDRSDAIPRTHRIEVLWPMCRQMLEETWPGKSSSGPDILDIVEACLSDFSRIDPSSTVFRYPLHGSEAELQSATMDIDVLHLSEVVGHLEGFFNAVDAMTGALWDAKRDAGEPCLLTPADDDIWSDY